MVDSAKTVLNDVLQQEKGPSGSGPRLSLNQASLEENLKSLYDAIEKVKSEIYETVQKNHQEFLRSYNNSQELKAQVEGLETSLHEISGRIRTAKENVEQSKGSHARVAQQLVTTNKIIVALRLMCELHDELSEIDAVIAERRYVDAARSTITMATLLHGLVGDSEDCDVRIVKAMRSEYMRKKSQLRAILEKEWADNLQWTGVAPEHRPGTPSSASLMAARPSTRVASVELRVRLTVTHGQATSPLLEVAEAMHQLGIFRARLSSFSRLALDHLYTPAVTIAGVAVKASSNVDAAVLSVAGGTGESAPAGTFLKPSDAYANVTTVVDFLEKYVLPTKGQQDSPAADEPLYAVRMHGEMVWDGLSAAIIGGPLVKAIPQQSTQLASYTPVIEETCEFEASMAARGIAPSTRGKLTEYAEDVAVHYANKKREELLMAARDLMTADSVSVVEVCQATERGQLSEYIGKLGKGKGEAPKLGMESTEGIFLMPRMQITSNTQALVEMAYQIMQEACDSTQQSAVQLFFSARDMFELFRAVVPAYHAHALDADKYGIRIERPQLPMLFHNDCMYIAHHLLTMGHEFQATIPLPITMACTFVDQVQPMRELGEEFFTNQMNKQVGLVLQDLAGAQGFANTHENQRFIVVEGAFKQVLERLTHLSRVWRVLPEETHHQAMGALLDTLCEHVTAGVLELTDISEDETHQLHYLMSLVGFKAPSLFQGYAKGRAASDQAGAGAGPGAVGKYATKFDRYMQLAGILETGMRDIVQKWLNGELEFSVPEVHGLIKALFMDTPLRTEQLAKVK